MSTALANIFLLWQDSRMEWKTERETYLRVAKMRRETARAMRQAGMTFAEIGKEMGVTRQRIQQMLAKKD